MKNRIIYRIIIGFIAGLFVGNLIALLSTGFAEIISPQLENSVGLVWGIVLQSVLAGLIGIAGIGGMSFYEIEKMGLFCATLCHYVCVVASFALASFVLFWGTWITFLIMLAIETAIFMAIWLIMYYKWKKNIKDMNEDLKKYKENFSEKNK